MCSKKYPRSRENRQERYKERLAFYPGDRLRLFMLRDKRDAGLPFEPDEQARWDAHCAFEQRKRTRRGKKLKAFRNRVGLSQQAFARLLGVSRRALCNYESGAYTPKPPIIEHLFSLGLDYHRCRYNLPKLVCIQRCMQDFNRVYRSVSKRPDMIGKGNPMHRPEVKAKRAATLKQRNQL